MTYIANNRSHSASPDDALVPLKPKQIRRFYEPIVLFKALTNISSETGTRERHDIAPKAKKEEERFHAYIDKLANLCDTEKGGKTVTACVVLDKEETTLYAFASNNITQREARCTKEFLQTLLEKISGGSKLDPAQKESVKNEVFSKILIFNRPRVEVYVHDLQKALHACLESCNDIDHKNKSSIELSLRNLSASFDDTDLERGSESEYLDSFMSLFEDLKAFLRFGTNRKFIDHHAKEGRQNDHHALACWSEFRHFVYRLQAYERAASTLFEAEEEWPGLFQMVEVVAIPSIRPGSNPLGKKSEKAENIIGRMSQKSDEMERYKKLAKMFQHEPYSLDSRIEGLCEKSFKPLVHCEILLLEWVLAKYPDHFFNDYKYIGTSKGACRLCNYYFEGHPSKIKARPSHGNLYIAWAFPPVVKRDEKIGVRRRQNMVNYIIDKIRGDTFEALEDKGIKSKRHDSTTQDLLSRADDDDDTRVEYGGSDTSDIDAEESDGMTELTEKLDADLSFTSVSTEETFLLSGSEDDDNDDEDGGTKLE